MRSLSTDSLGVIVVSEERRSCRGEDEGCEEEGKSGVGLHSYGDEGNRL
jgi:hypothetical protein